MAKKQTENISPDEPFEVTIRKWAATAAQQLRDSYKLQKMYVRGGSPSDYSVWERKGARRVYVFDKPYRRGQKRRRIKVIRYPKWTWYDESRLREQKQKMYPSSEYWFSTGESFEHINVTTHGLKSDDFDVEGEVRFLTTINAIFAEAGVGKTGPRRKRGGGDITVDRKEPYSYNRRYATWTPMRGDTHRPNVRQQVNYMRRRMVSLAYQKMGLKLNTWLQLTFQDLLDTGNQPLHVGGLNVTITPDPSNP